MQLLRVKNVVIGKIHKWPLNRLLSFLQVFTKDSTSSYRTFGENLSHVIAFFFCFSGS